MVLGDQKSADITKMVERYQSVHAHCVLKTAGQLFAVHLLTDVCHTIWPSQQTVACHGHAVYGPAESHSHDKHVLKILTVCVDHHLLWQVSKLIHVL